MFARKLVLKTSTTQKHIEGDNEMPMPSGNLLKSLLSKGRAAMLGGDEAMAGAGKFRTGSKGPWGQTAGGGRANMSGNVPNPEAGMGLEASGMGGPLGASMQTMRPLNEMDRIKMLLARMTPEQKAALLGAGGGLAAGGLGGGLGGYMAGGEGE
jgi:hypothetical protein